MFAGAVARRTQRYSTMITFPAAWVLFLDHRDFSRARWLDFLKYVSLCFGHVGFIRRMPAYIDLTICSTLYIISQYFPSVKNNWAEERSPILVYACATDLSVSPREAPVMIKAFLLISETTCLCF